MEELLFKKEDCCYNNYLKIINDIKQTGRYMDFSSAINADSYIVLRHDIEFSIDRAYNLAKLEASNEFYTSYFVQITNNAYNALSKKNIELLKEIILMGHKVGLHYHRNNVMDIEEIKDEIKRQAYVLSTFLNSKIDRFSFHRPAKQHLKANIEIDGLINTYASRFFTYTDDVTSESDLSVKYIADSNHQWKYGFPIKEYFDKYSKVQVLIHPLSWTEKGAEHVECFREISEEKRIEFIETVKNEWKTFYLLEGKL